MNTSISVVCYKSKTLADGKHPLMLQISKDGKRKYQSLGISINPVYWDFVKNKPKPSCPNGDFIQKIILDRITEVQKQILELGASQIVLTPSRILRKNESTPILKTLGEFYKELIVNYRQNDKLGNKKVYVGCYNSILEFSKGRMNIQFADIDKSWLTKYEMWLRSKGNKETTISLRFRTLRSIYNKAIEAKCARRSDYPFDSYKVSKFDVKTRKRAITKEDILKIMQLDISAEKPTISLSRDIFIFSYLTGGINFSDIANLKPENIKADRIIYTRQKTGNQISIQVNKEAALILNRYSNLAAKGGYLFPILDSHVHKSAIQKQNRIHKCLVITNKGLKRIAFLAGIQINLSTYVARHSFATVLKNSGVNVTLISEALGHSDLATTQIYLDSFENKQIDEALSNLL
jgi:site-specific recombinase XerD